MQALWGTTLLIAPGGVLRVLGGADEARTPKRIMRVLGARHLLQATAELVFGEKHYESERGSMDSTPYRLRLRLCRCALAPRRSCRRRDHAGFAAVGLSELSAGQSCADVIWPRRGPTGRRVIIASTIGLACGIGVSFTLPWQSSELVGWDVASLIFLVSTWFVIGPKSAADTKVHAAS